MQLCSSYHSTLICRENCKTLDPSQPHIADKALVAHQRISWARAFQRILTARYSSHGKRKSLHPWTASCLQTHCIQVTPISWDTRFATETSWALRLQTREKVTGIQRSPTMDHDVGMNLDKFSVRSSLWSKSMHSSDLWSSHQAWLAEPSPVTGCEIGIWCYRAINFRDSRTFFLQFFGTERNKPVEKLVQCFSNLAPTSKLCCNCSFRAHYRSMSIDPVLGMCQVLKNVWKFWSLLFRRF